MSGKIRHWLDQILCHTTPGNLVSAPPIGQK